MTPLIENVWVYLAAGPLIWLTATLGAYAIAHLAYARTGMNPLVNPVAVAVVLLVVLLFATGVDYAPYFEGAQFVHFLLGPATVALARSAERRVGNECVSTCRSRGSPE